MASGDLNSQFDLSFSLFSLMTEFSAINFVGDKVMDLV